MMKKILFPALFFLYGLVPASAQDTLTRHKIALFSPLYLDSAFNDTAGYRYAKNFFPKFINPGLEFYEGAQLALDSLNREHAPLEVFVYDTRSSKESLSEQLNNAEKENVELILAFCSSNEVKQFADAGLKRNIPVINVNLPNEGGTTGNPFFVMLNPTLRTQCEGIYKHVQKYYSLGQVVVFRKKGQLEDRIKTYFDDFGKKTMGVPLQMKYVDLLDSFSVEHLKAHLDTTKQALCIAGSLDENFGKRLVQQLASLKKAGYPVTVMGMPTWDGVRDFIKPEYKGLEIIYSTPFYNSRLDKVSKEIIGYFNSVMFARPSDMVMRGYETMWRFGKLLLTYKSELASNLTRKEFSVFREFDIQPVLNPTTMMLDYLENKKLFFLKWQDGLIRAVY